jgi:oxepin-CoA hydrolase/3-oxo-5,6-dehydrosuberyl-CoA semialdehyde dehydrogenase
LTAVRRGGQNSRLQSHIAGRWIGSQAAAALRSAINGHTVAHTHAEAIDFAEALHHARSVGLPTC